jgi:uncharacterized membrane protein YgcG
MLKLLAIASCLLATSLGQETSESSEGSESSTTRGPSVGSNYYRYYFNSLFYMGYAVDQCSSVDFSGTSYIMPTCIDGTHIDVAFYSDSSCSTLSSVMSYNSTSSEVFNCGGSNTYQALTLGIGSCAVSVFFGVGACVQYGPASSSYSSVSCSDSTMAYFKVFSDSTCTGTPMTTYNFTDSCAFSFFLSSSDIYGQIDTCYTGISTTSVSGESSESSTESSDESSSESESGGISFSTTTTSGTGGGGNGGSGGDDSGSNMISFKNILGIFIMVAACAIGKL